MKSGKYGVEFQQCKTLQCVQTNKWSINTLRQNKAQMGDGERTGANNDQGQIQGRKKTVNRNLRPWNSKVVLFVVVFVGKMSYNSHDLMLVQNSV